MREVAQVGELRSVERNCGRAPQETADADEPVIVREPLEVACEIGRADFKLAHKKRKEGIVPQQIEDPLVVFDQRARFDDAGGEDAVGDGHGFVIRRQDVPVDFAVGRRPRDSARARCLIEVDVGIEDGVGMTSVLQGLQRLRNLVMKARVRGRYH